MTTVAICTDSSALFPPGVVDTLGVTVVPIAITLGGASFDDAELAIDDFYVRLADGAPATTSQPSPGRLLEAYEAAARSGAEEVLSIHLDGRVSGTIQSAELAARDAPIPVTVVDTTTVSFGVGVCVRAAAAALADVASASEAAAVAGAVGATLGNVFVASGGGARGRLPDAAGWAVLEFADGTAVASAVCVDPEQAIEEMVARVAAAEGRLQVAVGHAAASTESAADVLAGSLAALPRVAVVERYRVGAAVGVHTGPLSFGAFWWPPPEPPTLSGSCRAPRPARCRPPRPSGGRQPRPGG
jgi:fatty acid-binding protein DegV